MSLRLGVSLVMLTLVLQGCDKNKSAEPPAPSASAVAVKPPAPAPKPPPADIDLEVLGRDLSCDKKSKSDVCRVFGEFRDAESWKWKTPSGEGRWMGTATVRDQGKEHRELLVLWAKVVPTSRVDPGDLPLRTGFGSVPDDLQDHGEKMVSSLSRSDVPSPHNQALAYVESFVPKKDRGAVMTSGKSVRLISEDTVYLRQQGRKVLILMPKVSSSGSAGDGSYAELWPVTW